MCKTPFFPVFMKATILHGREKIKRSANNNHKPHERSMSYFDVYDYAENRTYFHTNLNERKKKIEAIKVKVRVGS
jgi:hypothetical protein